MEHFADNPRSNQGSDYHSVPEVVEGTSAEALSVNERQDKPTSDSETDGTLRGLGITSEETKQNATADHEPGSTPGNKTHVAVGGIRKIIAKRKLKRVTADLEHMEHMKTLPPKIVARNDRKAVKIGKRGAANYGLRRVHGTNEHAHLKSSHDTGSITELRTTVVYDWNQYRIGKKKPKIKNFVDYREQLLTEREDLEAKLGIVQKQQVSTPKYREAVPAKPLDARVLNSLRDKEVHLSSHEAYMKALELAKVHDVVDDDLIATVVEDKSSPQFRLLKRRLSMEGDWIVDGEGNVLRDPKYIDEMLASDSRPRKPRSFNLERAKDLFSKDGEHAEAAIGYFLSQDVSERTPEEKMLRARRMALRFMMRSVAEDDRPLLGSLFERWLKAEAGDSAPGDAPGQLLSEVLNPVQLYNETAAVAKDILEKDTSDDSDEQKLANVRIQAFDIVTDGLLPEEREELFEQFNQIDLAQRENARNKEKGNKHSRGSDHRERRAPRSGEKDSRSEAKEWWQEIASDPQYKDLFDTYALSNLYDDINAEVRPLKNAKLKQLNKGKALEDQEKTLPDDEYHKIIDPISLRKVDEYVATMGADVPPRVKEAIKLAYLDAKNQLKKKRT